MITTEKFRGIVKKLCAESGAGLFYGPDSAALSNVMRALDYIGVVDAREWLNTYSITIGDHVYLSFKVGDKKCPLISQLLTIIHELTHVGQWRRDPLFLVRYLTNTAHRTAYEIEAIEDAMSAYWVVTGRPLDINDAVKSLEAYRIKKADLKSARIMLTIKQAQIAKANVRTADWW